MNRNILVENNDVENLLLGWQKSVYKINEFGMDIKAFWDWSEIVIIKWLLNHLVSALYNIYSYDFGKQL